MYNVKGPSKIVAKTTRRGISQNVDNMREYTRNKSVEHENKDTNNVPKPVFHKKSSPNQHRQEVITPQHEEIIKYISDSWNSVYSDVCQQAEQPQPRGAPRSVYYEEKGRYLENFKPFDLEAWWGKRLYDHITELTNAMEEITNDAEKMDLRETDSADNKTIMDYNTEANYEFMSDFYQNQRSQNNANSPCSTTSRVRLQCDYEDLWAKYHGLLELLKFKNDEIQKLQKENNSLKLENEGVQSKMNDEIDQIHIFHDKLYRLRERKNQKIRKLKIRNESLQSSHDQLLQMLHSQYMEKDKCLANSVKNCTEPIKALLLQEMRKNNLLIFENFQLNQQIQQLKMELQYEDKVTEDEKLSNTKSIK